MLTSLLSLAIPLAASAAVINVGPGGGTPLQDAIDAAVAGDTILIAEGVYPEKLVIDNSGHARTGLILIGEKAGKVIIDPAAGALTGNAITVGAGSVALQSLTVRHATGDGINCNPPAAADACIVSEVIAIGNGGDGVDINGDNAVVTDSELRGNGAAGLKINGDGAQVTDNLTRNNAGNGLDLTGHGMTVDGNTVRTIDNTGVHLNGDGNTVSSNRVSFAKLFGIRVNGVGNAVSYNTVAEADNDCYALDGNGLHAERNKAEGCGGDGFDVKGQNPVLIGNTAEGTVARGMIVLCTVDCTTMLIQNNRAIGSSGSDGFSITVGGAPAPALSGWLVEKNQARSNVGHGLDIDASNGTVAKNKAVDNGTGDAHGLNIKGLGLVVVSNQAVSNHGDGIHLVKKNTADANRVERNKADRNVLNGIHVGDGSVGNTLHRNNVKQNLGDGIRNDGPATILTANKASANLVDCAGDLADGDLPATDTNNKCADGSGFSTTQHSDIH
jgi:hypothetical protein